MHAVITHKFFPLRDFDRYGHKDLLECASVSNSNSPRVLDGNCTGSVLIFRIQLIELNIAVLEGGLV